MSFSTVRILLNVPFNDVFLEGKVGKNYPVVWWEVFWFLSG